MAKVIITTTQVIVRVSCRDSFTTLSDMLIQYEDFCKTDISVAVTQKEDYICNNCCAKGINRRCERCKVQLQLDEIDKLLLSCGVRRK